MDFFLFLFFQKTVDIKVASDLILYVNAFDAVPVGRKAKAA